MEDTSIIKDALFESIRLACENAIIKTSALQSIDSISDIPEYIRNPILYATREHHFDKSFTEFVSKIRFRMDYSFDPTSVKTITHETLVLHDDRDYRSFSKLTASDASRNIYEILIPTSTSQMDFIDSIPYKISLWLRYKSSHQHGIRFIDESYTCFLDNENLCGCIYNYVDEIGIILKLLSADLYKYGETDILDNFIKDIIKIPDAVGIIRNICKEDNSLSAFMDYIELYMIF